MEYLFIAQSNDDVEYCLNNEISNKIEADSLEGAIIQWRYIFENRENVEKYGENPNNPYDEEWTSSIHGLTVYEIKQTKELDVQSFKEEIEKEIEQREKEGVENEEKEELRRLQNKYS